MTPDGAGTSTTDPDVAAIVLAGGRASRFGSDKLAALIDARPMILYAIDAVGTVAAHVVVVTAPDDHRPLPDGVSRVADERPYEGPLVGLAQGLAAVPPPAAVVLVVGGDMPGMVPAVLRLLVDRVRAGAAGAVLDDGERPRPLPAAYAVEPARRAATALAETGERRLRALPRAVAATVIQRHVWGSLDPTGATLRDIDAPADLADAPGHGERGGHDPRHA